MNVVLVGPINDSESIQWDYVLSHWVLDQLFLVGDIPIRSNPFKGAIQLSGLGDLPKELTTVLLAPKTGFNVRGEISLQDFEHPENATYLFGSNHRHLDIGNDFEPTYRVYIPTESHHEMFSFVSAAITLYDRSIKNGEPDY